MEQTFFLNVLRQAKKSELKNLRKGEFKFEKMQFQFKGNMGSEIDKYFHF